MRTLTQLKYDEDIDFLFTDTFDLNELKCIEIEADMLDDLQNGKFGTNILKNAFTKYN